MRVQIDDQHPFTGCSKRGAEVDGSRGLADAALLVGERNNPRAGRIDGMTPAALGILAAYLRREARRKTSRATA